MFFSRETVDSLVVRGSLLAQTETTAGEYTPVEQFIRSPIPLIVGLMAIFYLVVMMPERRRKADELKKLSAIKKNDRIVTIGGIHGVVSAIVDADTLTIRLDENGMAKMKIDRSAVARVLADSNDTSETKD